MRPGFRQHKSMQFLLTSFGREYNVRIRAHESESPDATCDFVCWNAVDGKGGQPLRAARLRDRFT